MGTGLGYAPVKQERLFTLQAFPSPVEGITLSFCLPSDLLVMCANVDMNEGLISGLRREADENCAVSGLLRGE